MRQHDLFRGLGKLGEMLMRANLPDEALLTHRDARDMAKRHDLPPVDPSFITRVCRLDFGIPVPRLAQARRARSPQIAQALGALAVASGFRATNEA